jgi:hypothetical protein
MALPQDAQKMIFAFSADSDNDTSFIAKSFLPQ